MTRLPQLAAAITLPALVATAAHAAPPRRTRRPEPAQRREEIDPKAYRHEGFFLRLALGPGYQSLEVDAGFDTLELDGVGFGSSVAIGGIIQPNLALHADFFAAAIVNPNATLNGVERGELESSVSVSGVGIGATYFFMPSNMYASFSLGLGTLTFEFDGNTSESESAFALNAVVGREFWVDPEWGVGVAGQFTYLDVAEDGRSLGDYRAFNLLFSATYN
jgi:hypothetical protein